MASTSKKMALLAIKEILEERTDEKHKLTQEKIGAILADEYEIVIDRRAVSRNIDLLIGADIDIIKERDGCYLGERIFEDAELHMMIDGILCSHYITPKRSKYLIERLCGLSSRYFRSHVKHIHTVDDQNKTENNRLFYTIAAVDEAIEKRLQITFDFNRYGVDKKLHKTASHRVSPYGMILHNQRYYLMGLNEKYQSVVYYRMDHINNMEITKEKATPIRSIHGYENGIDYKKFSTQLPYLFNDDPVHIELMVDSSMIDELLEWFGRDVILSDKGDSKVYVLLTASPQAMRYWALQFVNHVEVLSPTSLRQEIREDLQRAGERYS